MLASTATVPKNALTTAQLSKDQLVELYQLTRSTWLTPVEALSREDSIILGIQTENLFPWVVPQWAEQQWGGAPVSTWYKPVVQRWADRLEEDDSLPELPASWFNR